MTRMLNRCPLATWPSEQVHTCGCCVMFGTQVRMQERSKQLTSCPAASPFMAGTESGAEAASEPGEASAAASASARAPSGPAAAPESCTSNCRRSLCTRTVYVCPCICMHAQCFPNVQQVLNLICFPPALCAAPARKITIASSSGTVDCKLQECKRVPWMSLSILHDAVRWTFLQTSSFHHHHQCLHQDHDDGCALSHHSHRCHEHPEHSSYLVVPVPDCSEPCGKRQLKTACKGAFL